MQKFMTGLAILICAVALMGCKSHFESQAGSPPADAADTFEITGTVVHKNLEGGFFAIDGDDGSKYNPVNLPDSLKRDGLKVKATARQNTDAMSLHMYGTIVEIVEIKAR